METPNYVFRVHHNSLSRVNFWSKMALTIGATQIFIGLCCAVFYLIAFGVNASLLTHSLQYIGVGVSTGAVIIASGVSGVTSSKKKTSCLLVVFLVTSSLSALFSLFPLILGILGATQSEQEHLLMPICQLTLATVELIVAIWAIGLASQAVCCPTSNVLNAPSRLIESPALPQFVANGNNHHIIMFSPSRHQAILYPYAMTNSPTSHMLLQQGLPAIQVQSTNNRQVTEDFRLDGHYRSNNRPVSSRTEESATSKRAPAEQPGEEREKLLQEDAQSARLSAEPTDNVFEVEDEGAHLLS